MVNGPPCQACGWTLRWAGERGVWLCDRCGAAVAPAPPPSQPMYPQGPPVAAVAPPVHTSSKKGLWIAIGGVVVVAGIVIAVVAASGGSSETAKDQPAGSGVASADKPAPEKPAALDAYAVMLAKLTEFKDHACACKDKACIDAVQADMKHWTADPANSAAKIDHVDEAATKQMTAVMETLTKCAATIVAATPAFAVGDRVMARWTNGRWYPGKISAAHANGTFDIAYDDGDRSTALPASSVRKRTASSSSSSSSSSRPAGDAPCPGPGLTRRCNGVCVNIQENNNHCGGCNNRCPSGKSCDGHMFCRDAQGNL